MQRIERTDAEWREALSPERYHILREAGTELRFSGDLLDNKKPGRYVCAGCGNPLFHSASKFDSGSGWPSFFETIGPDADQKRCQHTHVFLQRLCIHGIGCDGGFQSIQGLRIPDLQ